jgi:Mn2+/Fe2+ NRAMP family transporter
MVILIGFLSSMTALVDMVTTISFVLAPVFAVMNYLAIMSPHVPKEARPNLITHIVSWTGILFLLVLALYYLWMRYVPLF